MKRRKAQGVRGIDKFLRSVDLATYALPASKGFNPAMPNIKVKVNPSLPQAFGFDPSEGGDRTVSVREGQSIPETVRCLAEENGLFWKSIFDEKNQIIHPGVLIILNGRVANPYDPTVILQEGDNLTFLPMMDGG